MLDVKLRTIENVESGRQRPPSELLEAICDILPHTMSYLMTGKEDFKLTSEQKKLLNQFIKRLSEESYIEHSKQYQKIMKVNETLKEALSNDKKRRR